MPENIRKSLRKGLDKYEGHYEKKEERYWSWVSRGMNALDDRSVLKRFFFLLLGFEFLFWVFVLAFPNDVIEGFTILEQWSDRGVLLVVGIVFGTGLYISYVLFRFRFPDLESPKLDDGPVIGAYSKQEGNERKFRVWVISVVAGVFNVLALFGVLILRAYGL
ncbi:MAG: hypothetical protein KF881_00050 [Acidobacteria bacterium]|nr:hypothetical protein [Acidobacteriota bacterium]